MSLRTVIAAMTAVLVAGSVVPAIAQSANDAYRPSDPYAGSQGAPRPNDAYVPQQQPQSYYGGTPQGQPNYAPPPYSGNQPGYAPPPAGNQAYGAPPYGSAPPPYGAGPPQGDPYAAPGYGPPPGQPPPYGGSGQAYGGTPSYGGPQYGAPYAPPPEQASATMPPPDNGERATYSRNEILDAGHSLFGAVSQGLASAVEYAFQKAGRPNGYIIGEDAGGAFIAGLRYGEGTLFTKDAGNHKVYWQGPSLGYDVGAEGSKTMVLVYHLRDPSDIYNRFGGVQGSAYFVGGVGVQFQQYGNVILAPIRAGVGLRLGANVGYLKYTPTPTWNPF